MASFGENLRRERELRGVALREIADATKISSRFLQALEQDRVDILPGGVFRRAFVREYARYLGLDHERIVSEFIYLNEPKEEVGPRDSRSVPYGLLGVVLLLGAAAALSFLRPFSSRSGRDSSASPVRVAAASAPAVPRMADRVYTLPSEATASAEAGGLVVTLSARQDCWVSAEVDGQMVLNRVLSGGESQTLEASGQIVLSVGNAGGLSFKVNDKPGVPLGRTGEVRRNIVISRKSLPSLVEDASTRSDPSS